MRENRNVPFRDWNIRVSRNHNGQLHICAVDICDILKRDELLENGAIARVCPTALKISFRKNGREQWGFRPIDMRRLLQLVRKETIIPRDLLDELEVWGNKLLELEAGELHAVPQDDIVMHFEERFPVTFRRVGDKLMVNATQITMHFGKIPSEWLRIASTDMLRREMAGNGHTGKYESQVFTTRGRGHGATWLESPLVIGGMVGRGYRQTLRETREDNRTRTPQGGGTRSALYGLSHAAGYGIGDETDSGTAEGGE